MKKPRRLSPLRVLVTLYELGGCGTVEDLSRGLGLKKSTIRAYLSVLEKKGLIRSEITRAGKPIYCVEL